MQIENLTSDTLNSAATASNSPKSTRTSSAANGNGEKLAEEMKVFLRVASELRGRLNPSLPENLRRRQVVEIASELFGVAPTWVAFFREVMGVDGIARTLFPCVDSYREYESSEEHSSILEMLTELRSRDLPENDPSEQQRMITVRMAKSVHDYICDEANRLQVSVNKLCISRLLQRLDERMIPSSQQKRRGRKPGAAYNTSLVEVNAVASSPTNRLET